MKLEDLPKNTCYYAEYADRKSFVIAENNSFPTKNLWSKINEYGDLDIVEYYKVNNPGAIENIRLATSEEIHWLDCCIAEGGFVEYEEALKTFNDTIIFQDDPKLSNILIKLLTQ